MCIRIKFGKKTWRQSAAVCCILFAAGARAPLAVDDRWAGVDRFSAAGVVNANHPQTWAGEKRHDTKTVSGATGTTALAAASRGLATHLSAGPSARAAAGNQDLNTLASILVRVSTRFQKRGSRRTVTAAAAAAAAAAPLRSIETQLLKRPVASAAVL